MCFIVQVMLVGDSGVGKTCLLVRFKDGAFLAGSFISTVGIDFRSHSVSLKPKSFEYFLCQKIDIDFLN
ncbi:Ras- protein Rab-26 [Goodea atripinnis]|uniref:Ras- protein Rab-26 n=1 Tax=Goodea atripinnis TaxID=208336 RepID=A0ABV0Q0U4_9TELE